MVDEDSKEDPKEDPSEELEEPEKEDPEEDQEEDPKEEAHSEYDSPNMPKHAPTHGQETLAHLSIIWIAPDLPTQDPATPTYLATQQIFGAHTATLYDSQMSLAFAFEAPTFTTQARVKVPYKVDQYAKMEKDARLKEDESIDAQLRGLR
ncbi:uncharacterized protein LOC129892815 [Solanum dulcamara]|uniref:uncharacterized protein LOC129892815 n=1 Tax=Solanum dulcamara TaxID=45834 RepID=UPI0024859BA4|nr:uncharacterized protein LOC129892815 [Solanum dulcamara]